MPQVELAEQFERVFGAFPPTDDGIPACMRVEGTQPRSKTAAHHSRAPPISPLTAIQPRDIFLPFFLK